MGYKRVRPMCPLPGCKSESLHRRKSDLFSMKFNLESVEKFSEIFNAIWQYL